MKWIKRALPLVFMVATSLRTFGNDSLKPLQVGDVVPGLQFNTVLGPAKSPLHLSDYRGKFIILDFWATWCSPCVASFPKLEEIQKKHGKQLQILLATAQKPDIIESFYRIKPDFLLPSVVMSRAEDSVTQELFPHLFLPHYVWIDNKGVVQAISGREEVNEKNIHKFIRGMPLNLNGKSAQPIPEFSQAATTIHASKGYYYQSLLTPYDSTKMHSTGYNKAGLKNRYLGAMNCSVKHLFQMAYEENYKSVPENRVLMEGEDETVNYPDYASKQELHEWERKYSYCYELILPERLAGKQYEIMREDIARAFGYTAAFETRMQECLVLRSNDTARIITKGGKLKYLLTPYGFELTNQPITSFIIGLEHQGKLTSPGNQQSYIIIDETGIKQFVDIRFQAPVTDLRELNKALGTLGLRLDKEKREVKMLVISKQRSR